MDFSKRDSYYGGIRTELIRMLPSLKGRFLEVGCGTGGTLEFLKSNGASYVAGIDINEKAIGVASRRGLDFVAVADVESDKLPFEEKEFDCIILADILEHLYNPWDTLKRFSSFLKEDGHVLLSIPNIKYAHILRRLIFHDEWAYCEEGILDNTHVRFFTLKEIEKLLGYAGLKISELKWREVSGKKFKILNTMLFNKIRSFSIFQYYIMADKR